MIEVRSRMSRGGRTLIPKAVRQRLGVQTGDFISFRVNGNGAVTIDRVRPDEDNPFVNFAEWTSDEDEKLYARL